MNRYEGLVSHLPSLYKPEEDEESLFNLLLHQLGLNMDELSRDLTLIMQSHWFKTADKASYDPHFIRSRELAELPPVQLHNLEDKRLIAKYPYLLDLAKLGALLSIPPRREPAVLRETVEEYRVRLQRIIEIYRNGLGTLAAIRNMVTAELPETHDLALPARARSFSIEENSPYLGSVKTIKSIDRRFEVLGPLMRWQLFHRGLGGSQEKSVPIVYIEGIAATAEHDATLRPMVERFSPGGMLPDIDGLAAIGVGYLGTLAEGEVLRLHPAYSACLSGNQGVLLSSIKGCQVTIDNWQPAAGAPSGQVRCSFQSTDKQLWFVFDDGGEQKLYRFDGSTWLEIMAAASLPPIHCLQQRDQQLLIGHDNGLSELNIFPDAGSFLLQEIPDYTGQTVYCCEKVIKNRLLTGSKNLYIGTSAGLSILDRTNIVLETLLTDTVIRAVSEGDTALYCGGDAGLFCYKYLNKKLYYLSAEHESELQDDWLEVSTEELPLSASYGLPQINCLHVTQDGVIWIGSERGFARYRARHEGDMVYRNLLESFTELADGRVSTISEDEHGFLWFTTNRGLFRFDGRDLARFQIEENSWQQLGEAGLIYLVDQSSPRSPHRFDIDLNRWEFFDYSIKQWSVAPANPDFNEEHYTSLLFLDRVESSIGSLEGTTFTKTADVAAEDIVLRCKPDHTRIVDGGFAAIPRLPNVQNLSDESGGVSDWRYLSIEAEDLVDVTDLPWWSTEGRLVPPPDHDAPYPGRFSVIHRSVYELDQMVFAYNPAAKIKFQWPAKKPLQVTVRLLKRNSNDVLDPAILDRVWKGINQVRPAGVQLLLAVDDEVVRQEIT